MPLLQFRKFPWATAGLALALLLAYFGLSGETPYIPSSLLYSLSSSLRNPVSLVTYLFVHIGIVHLVGNLVPFLLFALLLESAARSRHVVFLFLFSGALSALAFSFTNPFITLIGASAGISGLMAAAMVLRPKQSLVLLIALPLLVPLVIVPGVNAASVYYDNWLNAEKQSQQQTLQQKINESQFNKSPELQQQIAVLNQTITQTETKIKASAEGKAREEAVPSDFFVHVYGVLAGLAYVYFFLRREAIAAKKEFVELGDLLTSIPQRIRQKQKRRR